MESTRWKNASLAINAIIRGLELDQIAFHYDEAACLELTVEGRGAQRKLERADSSRDSIAYSREV